MVWLKRQSRKWHMWLGVVFAIPLCVVALTTLFMAHDKAIPLEHLHVKTSFFPGYEDEKYTKAELRAYLDDGKGTLYLGYKQGLQIIRKGEKEVVSFFANHDIRKLILFRDRVVVGSRNGLFIQENEGFFNALKEMIWDISIVNNELFVVSKNGLFHSKDLKEWEKITTPQTEMAVDTVSLKKLTMDLHTGKALFGENRMWIWQDILALCLLFFIFTGVYLWYTKKRQKTRVSRSEQC